MRVNVNQTKSSNQIVPQQELSSNEKTVTSMDVTEEDEEEEKKIQKIERKSRPSYFRTLFSLRNLLTLFMSGLSMMTIVVLGAVGVGFFASNVIKNVNTVKDVYFANVCARIFSALDTAATGVISASTTVELNLLDNKDFNAMRPYLWDTFQKCRHISPLQVNVYTGTTTGEFGGYWIVGGVMSEFHNYNDIYSFEVTPVLDNVTGAVDPSQTVTSPLNYEAVFESPWYVLSQNTSLPSWTNVYALAEYPQYLWLSFVVSLRNHSNGDWLGFFASDLATDTLGHLVAEEARSIDENEIIIVEKSTGYVVAISDATPLFKVHDDGSIERYDGSNSRTPQIRETLRHVRKKYGRLFTTLGMRREEMQIRTGSRSIFIALQPLVDRHGLEWIVIQSTNRVAFYGQFFNNIITIAILSMALLFFSFVLALLIGTAILKPLRHLLVNVKYLESMKLEEVESELTNFSFITEVRGLQSGFLIMIKRLKTLRSFIPDHVLSALESDDQNTGVNSSSIQLKRQHHGRDDTTSDTSTLNYSSHLSSSQRTKSTLAIGVRTGELTVVVIEIDNTAKYFEEGSPSDYSNLYRDVINMVHSLSRKFGAEFVSCTHNQITLVWNAFNPFTDHIGKACSFMTGFKNQLLTLQSQWSRHSILQTSIHIGLCSRMGYYGNIGSMRQRYFTVFGPVLDGAMDCVTTAREWNIGAVCCSNVTQSIENSFMTRPFTSLLRDPSFVMYEIGQMKAVKADEWMYEMEEKEKHNKWSPCIQAFDHMRQRNWTEASKLLTAYLENEPGDAVAQQMLSRCETLEPETAQ